jgi:hypothetical protein
VIGRWQHRTHDARRPLGREKADAQSRDPDIGSILDSLTGGSGGAKGRSGTGGIMDSIGDLFGKKDR